MNLLTLDGQKCARSTKEECQHPGGKPCFEGESNRETEERINSPDGEKRRKNHKKDQAQNDENG